MAKDQPSGANLVHHYTHVVCALSETLKGLPTPLPEDKTSAHTAINNTVVGVCQLIDKLVADKHREMAVSGRGVN